MTMWYQWAPVVLGMLAAWSAWSVPRAVAWVALILTSFVISTVWWNAVGVHPAAFGAATDFLIAIVMLPYAKTTYETWILRGLCAMILIDIFQQNGAIKDHAVYAITLEALNWAVLIFIAFWGAMERVPASGRVPDRRRDAGWMGVVRGYFGKPAHYPRWWRVTG